MTAPPWSSAAPPQPVERPGDPHSEPVVDEPAAVDPDPAPESGDEAARRLPVYDDLLTFPESKESAPEPYPSQGAWPAVPPAFHQPAAYPAAEEPEPRGRNRTVVAVVIGTVVVAVAAAVGAGAVLLNRDPAPPPAPAPSAAKPKVSGPPPGDLRLQDDTTTITVTWSDPTGGGVPFVVAGGRAGQKLGVMATVDAGQTRYTVNGLSPKLDYCFTVLAVYSTDTYATSGQVCTDREGGTTPD
ncbi:fibronectin type III domain-containing protein [Micromonospora sp. NPDC023966]|uniref:fibronectin type III domain-containing protein n=1 Tax=Micromonospora sp. NPDC023966 TaxID=3154699 RepID=UPI0033F0177F